MKRTSLNLEEVRNSFEYIDGQLWRKAWTNKINVNYKKRLIENKRFDWHGYCRFSYNNRLVMYHVIVFMLTKGDIPEDCLIDHIDGNKLNNTPENLRLVSIRQNLQNMYKHRSGKLPGTSYRKDTGKWRSRVRVNKQLISLGDFTTQEEAHEVYKNYITENKLI